MTQQSKIRISTLFVLLAEILLAFSPFILPLNIPAADAYTIAYIGCFFGIATALIGFHLSDHARSLDTIVSRAEATHRLGSTSRESDESFIQQIRAQQLNATDNVSICYLSLDPPTDSADSERRKYYKDQKKIIRRKSGVKFRRIIRFSPANLEWARELAQQLNGLHNASIAILHDSPEDTMPLSPSVCVIDRSVCWMVAVASHERTDKHRDYQIHSEIVADAMLVYFDRLWSRAVLLLEHGRMVGGPT